MSNFTRNTYNGVLIPERGVVRRLVEFLQVQVLKSRTSLAGFLHKSGQVEALQCYKIRDELQKSKKKSGYLNTWTEQIFTRTTLETASPTSSLQVQNQLGNAEDCKYSKAIAFVQIRIKE